MTLILVSVQSVAGGYLLLWFNPLNAELNPIRHLLALVGARHIVHVSGIRVKEIKRLSNSGNSVKTSFFTLCIYIYMQSNKIHEVF